MAPVEELPEKTDQIPPVNLTPEEAELLVQVWLQTLPIALGRVIARHLAEIQAAAKST